MLKILHRQERKGLVFFALFASFAVGLSLTYTALAQNGEPTDDEVNTVAKQLYCPVCENIPLDVCPTEACIQWRADIREKLAAGWTEDQIKASFAERFGDRVLAQPPTSGLNILVWVLPPLALLAGAFFLVRYLRSSTSAQSAPALSGPPVAHDEFERQLEEELAKRR
jgi:cytochrome c-type biogenesis protein CcmH